MLVMKEVSRCKKLWGDFYRAWQFSLSRFVNY